ncbi:MAG TPA: GNAT family N-acetyltransferase [Myxococcaceae bacterium]|jgi:GNAT superfamily N-acetyltransferase
MTTELPSPARPDEEVVLTELLSAQLEEHGFSLAPELLIQAVRGALEEDSSARILVARDAGRPVGFAYVSVQWSLERGARVLWVEQLYVRPALREQGIGGRLLQAALDLARARGCLAAELEVDDSHGRAPNLYCRAGFRPLERVHYLLPLDRAG